MIEALLIGGALLLAARKKQSSISGTGGATDKYQNFYWGKDKLYVIMTKDGDAPITIEVNHVRDHVKSDIEKKKRELVENGYHLLKSYGDWSFTYADKDGKQYSVRVDWIVAY